MYIICYSPGTRNRSGMSDLLSRGQVITCIPSSRLITYLKIKSLYDLYQLSQLIDKPTRVTMTTSSLIDHIVTNTPEKISDSGVIHTGISDHSLVFAIRKISVLKRRAFY